MRRLINWRYNKLIFYKNVVVLSKLTKINRKIKMTVLIPVSATIKSKLIK